MKQADIRTYMAQQLPQMRRDLEALCAIPSFSGQPEPCAEALRLTLEIAARMGMETGITPQADAGYAQIGDGSETLGIYAHVDVVGIGDREKWLSDPFTLTERDGYLYARGVGDNKGCVIMSLYAMKYLLDRGLCPKKRIRLVVGTTEETQWSDMEHFGQTFGFPDYGYTPDGEFPIFNVAKGYSDAKLLFADTAGILAVTAGDSPNTIPSDARITLPDGEVRHYTGKSYHSSLPQNGDNAILKLAADNRQFAFARMIDDFFQGDFHGIKLGLDNEGKPFNGVDVGRTAISPTVLRLTDEGILLNVNIRHTYGTKRSDLEAAFAAHASEYGYRCTFSEFTPATCVDPEQPFLQTMDQVFRDWGNESGFRVARGASYAQVVPNCVAWGASFPDEPHMAHQENECYSIACLQEAAAIYADYLQRFTC